MDCKWILVQHIPDGKLKFFFTKHQLIGLRETLHENPIIFMGKSGWFPVSQFSLSRQPNDLW